MPETYHHGVRVIETATGGRALTTLATAVIGLVATAPDADNAVFPANQVVAITNLEASIAAAGATGTLKQALTDIARQVSTIVLVYVAEAAEPEDLEDAIVAGVKAMETAEAVVGFKPRILGAPDIDTQAVTVQLALTAKKLRARAYARAIGTTVAAILAYRAAFSARELMLIARDFTSAGVRVSAVATALGLRAAIDKTVGWNKTISNVVVDGVTGIEDPFYFDLQDSDTDVGALNAAGVTTLVSLNGAFRFWGSRTCSADVNFKFESAVATAQILADTCARGLAWAVDQPIHPSLARDLIEQVNAFFRRLKGQGLIIDARAYLPETNTAQSLAAGDLTIAYDYTPTPPLEDLTLLQSITDKYLADFAAQVSA